MRDWDRGRGAILCLWLFCLAGSGWRSTTLAFLFSRQWMEEYYAGFNSRMCARNVRNMM
jgi:hypothetical protein